MLYLSRKNIEGIGEAVLLDYAMKYPGDLRYPLHIRWFALMGLGLGVKHRKLSDSGNICGLTVYAGTEVTLPVRVGDNIICETKDTIYVDESLLCSECSSYLRFTIAHECAHQILRQMVERKTGRSFRSAFEPGKRYTCVEIKTAEYWWEWQANTLAAILLMPKYKLAPHLIGTGGRSHIFTAFGSRFNDVDYKRIKGLADMFGVSFSAMKIRLETLEYIVDRPESEYVANPLDVVADRIAM